MKLAGVILSLVSFSVFAFSQDVIITDGQTVNACGGTFYDTGGSTGQYQSSEDITFTICPDDPGNQVVVLEFTMFDVENGFEDFEVYDGPDVSSPLIGVYSGTDLNGQQVSADMNSATGCLTIHFTSDGSVTDAGWEASILCTYPCQDFSINLLSLQPVPQGPNGEVILCQGVDLEMQIQGVYPDNNLNYSQSDQLTTYTWTYGDQTADGTSLNTSFSDGGLFNVSVTGVDQNGCVSDNFISQNVLVGTVPSFDGTSNLTQGPICLGDTFQLSGMVVSTPFEAPLENVLAEETFLPDGSGVSYETSLTFNNFIPGQTITDVSQIISICADIEHSYLGDLEVVIICPDGSSAILKEYPGGSGTYLGEPVDDGSLTPGVGYDYCWTETAGYGTMVSEALSVATLPAGDYTPFESLTNLVGCPLNGDWTISITDNLGADNGYIFSWQINFDPAIIPPPFTFDPGVLVEGWQDSPHILSSNGTEASFALNTPGIHEFYYEMIDSLGCAFDTTVTVEIIDLPSISVVGGEGCAPLQVDFQNNTDGGAIHNYEWYLGVGSTDSIDTSFEPSYFYEIPGEYDVVVQITTAEGCVRTDLFQDAVLVYDQPEADFVITNEIIEVLSPEVFFENESKGATFYEWSFDSLGFSSDENTSYIFDEIGCYTVSLVSGNSDGCTDTTYENFCVQDITTFYVPSAFSPDGNGKNENFGYVTVGDKNQDVNFLIYNKWGELVFEGNSPEETWDGRDNSGVDAPVGVYVWMARKEAKFPGDQPLLKTGVVTLIR